MTPEGAGRGDLFAYGRETGLEEARLREDLDGDAIWERVREDADSAVASGALGTPTLFIDGRLHLSGYDIATLQTAVESIEARG